MYNVKSKIKAIIFDMDGTIIDTDHIWKKVVRNFLTQNGFETITEKEREVLRGYAGVGLLQSSELMKNQFNIPKTTTQIYLEKLKLSENFIASDPIKFIKGFKNFHKKLVDNNIATGIATNANLQNLSNFNEKMKLNSFFGNNMYSLEHVGNRAKPDPAVFLHTAKQLNVKPEECVIFEDSIHGFKAAQAAGIKCIAIKNSRNADQIQHAFASIDNYDQAEEILKKILL